MGSHSTAILAYGIDLGLEESIEVDEVPWFDADSEGEGYSEQLESYLLRELAGFTEKWTNEASGNGYYERLREAQANLGVELVYYCTFDYTGLILAAKGSEKRVYQGDTKRLSATDLETQPGWADKVEAAAKALNFDTTNIGWLITSIYG